MEQVCQDVCGHLPRMVLAIFLKDRSAAPCSCVLVKSICQVPQLAHILLHVELTGLFMPALLSFHYLFLIESIRNVVVPLGHSLWWGFSP